jgi:hypothetical protein
MACWLGGLGKLGSIQIARYKKLSTWLFGASIQPSIPSKSGSSPKDHQLLTYMFLKTSSYELLAIGRVTTCMPLSKCYIKFFNKHVVWCRVFTLEVVTLALRSCLSCLVSEILL